MSKRKSNKKIQRVEVTKVFMAPHIPPDINTCIIEENADNIVVAIRIPKVLIREHSHFLAALSERAT